MSLLSRPLKSLLITLCLSVSVWGQMNLASVTGIVTDPTGAVVPNAKVAVISASTAVAQTTVSNAAGVYVVSSLASGAYDIEVSAQGFKPRQIKGIEVTTGDRARVDVALQIGEVTGTVEVTASAPLLQSETAEISKGISTKEVIDVPASVSRSPYQFVMLATGVAAKGSATSPTTNSTVSINGSRAQSTAYVIDGASTTHIGGIGELVGTPEAIQEVKMLTNGYSAEYGRTSGATVIFNVKSGGSKYRGSLFEFNRNNALAAGNWADNARNIPVRSLNTNQFGASVGGPVPGLGSKLFFFAAWESQIDRSPNNRVRTIPGSPLRSGNFSGLPTTVFDPNTGQPFPGNVIPANRLDPAAMKLMALLPEPNQPGVSSAFGITTNNYVRLGSNSDPLHTGTSRLDFNITDRDKLFWTYSQNTQGPRDQGIDFDNVLTTVQGPRNRNIRRTTVGYSRVIRPNLISEFLAHAQRDPRVIEPWFPDFDVTKELGVRRRVGNTLPSVNITGAFGSFGQSDYQNWVHQPAGLSEILTWTRGKHNLRFGAQFLQNQFWYISANNVSGSYSFTGELTGNGVSGRNNPINPLADLLLGLVKTASAPVAQIPINRTNYNFGSFVQDDWKITRRLTLNLGLRYEFETRQIVKNDVYSRLDLGTGNLLVAGVNASRNLNLQNDYVNFSPRVGLAYLLNDRTVVRSGFAVFHSNFWVDNGEMVSYPGWTGTQNWVDPGLGRAQTFRFSDGFPVEQIPSVGVPLDQFASASAARPLPHSSVTYNPSDRLPYSLQWNLNIQRHVGRGFIAEVGYVASRSVRLSRTVPANQPMLDKAPDLQRGVALQNLRPFPKLAGFNAVYYDANSSYHSFQARTTRRFSNGLSLDANYTFSKNMDNSSRFEDSFQIPWQFASIEKGLSSFDIPHIFNSAFVYELPFGKGKLFGTSSRIMDLLTGGFQINGSLTAQSGEPMTITQTNTNLLLSSQRPDVRNPARLSGRMSEPVFEGASLRWLIAPNSPDFPFVASSPVSIGNLGRSTSRGPGYFNTNLSIFKRVAITERVSVTIRFEAYNALNRVNYGSPSTNINSATYGQITSADPARQVQLGARLTF